MKTLPPIAATIGPMAKDEQHPPSRREPLLQAGRNCWRIEHAQRCAFLIDGSAYFTAVRAALVKAQRSIFILGWDIDSRMLLVPEGANDGYPEPLGDFLNAVVARRRGLNAYVLSWDFAVLFALEREWLPAYRFDWRTHRRLHFRLDDRHPFGASHHQKVVVIDDTVAFVGGLDLTRCRWDTPEHVHDNALRIDPDGKPYPPFHDVQVIVDGGVAQALGELARERWCRATGQRLPPASLPSGQTPPDQTPRPDPWPNGLVADLTDVDIAIARTEPRFDGYAGVDEIRRLHVDAIASAQRHLYLENQYFTSSVIGDALAARLAEDQGPELVLVTPRRESGWLEENTMGLLRARLHARLSQAAHGGRYRPYCPELPGLSKGCLNVHSKVMTIDDEFVTVGSANLSNRSMGFDTECNLAIEARAQQDGGERVRQAIAAFRQRLLGEHLGVEPAVIASAMQRTGSLVESIESLRGGPRTLLPSDPQVPADIPVLLPEVPWVDPERPIDADQFVADYLPGEAKQPVAGRLAVIALVIVVLGGLAIAWRWTPLHQWLDIRSLIDLAEKIQDAPFTPVIVLGAYVLAALLIMPITLVIGVTGIVFGPLVGGLYAIGGGVLSAAVTYGIGRALGRDTVRRFAGKRVNRLSRLLARRGLIAMAIVRMLPVAPFTIVNIVAGAAQIRLRDFLLGTLFGLTPGIIATVVFVDRITAALRHPGPGTFALLGIVVVAVAAAAVLVRRRLSGAVPLAESDEERSRAD